MYKPRYYDGNEYIELQDIIPLGKWIPYDEYIKIWNNIWKFIDKKRSKLGMNGVWINNFAYNYMDTVQFYFSWEHRSTVKDGILIKESMFDYLNINHERVRRKKWKKTMEEMETMERPASRSTKKREMNGPKITELSEIKIEI